MHPLLTDFGVAHLIDTPRRTRATKIIGTPAYLAPEIAEGRPQTAAVDIYAPARCSTSCSPASPVRRRPARAVLRRHVSAETASAPRHPRRAVAAPGPVPRKDPRPGRPRAEHPPRELLPMLAGMAPLDVDEPDAEQQEDTPDESAASAASPAAPASAAQPVRRPGAVPLVPGAKPADSNRDTHTSMRVPAPDELAGGARGTARAPPPRVPRARLGPQPRHRAAAPDRRGRRRGRPGGGDRRRYVAGHGR
ncbi:non-specific serine/threonine protein kinase OS=Streptomyces tendae OX=1932 GN=GUR47_07555 PE=4 SV=1 [Streptomyces tendae]